MKLTDRTALIVGATSGIGRGLARRLARAGNTVIVGGRNVDALAELADEGFGTVEIDVTDSNCVERARDRVLSEFPQLDVVVSMSGVLLIEDLRDPQHFETAQQTIDTNLLGTIRVMDAFTPHLIERGSGTLMTVSSGIAFLPFPAMPTYGASKAGVHAYTEALRAQLDGTGVEVVELVPPAIATAGQENIAPHALPLDGYLDEVLALLGAEPTPNEILVQGVHMHRWAERDGSYADLVAQRSQLLPQLLGRA
jgi:short-subunit dehydrogenase involved in D-alanine esterification of teichoic acids